MCLENDETHILLIFLRAGKKEGDFLPVSESRSRAAKWCDGLNQIFLFL